MYQAIWRWLWRSGGGSSTPTRFVDVIGQDTSTTTLIGLNTATVNVTGAG